MYQENEKTESLNERLVGVAQDWLRERELFWSSPESTPEIDEWQSKMYELNDVYYGKAEIHEMLDGFTTTIERVFSNSDKLSINELSYAEYIVNHIFDGPCGCPFYEEVFEMANAKILIATGGKFGGAAEKILDVIGSVGLIFDKKLAKRVMRAIQDAKRDYVLGRDAACIVFCRTAIELALKEKIDDEMLTKHLGPKKTKHAKYDISDYLAVAAKEGLLTETTRKLADNVRYRANQTCHEDTSLTQKVCQLFDKTCRVVCTLYTGKDPMQPLSDAEQKARHTKFIIKYAEVFKKITDPHFDSIRKYFDEQIRKLKRS